MDVTGDPVFCSRPESLEVWLDSVDSDLALFRDSAANLTDFFLAMVKSYTTDTTHEERGEEGGRERKRGPDTGFIELDISFNIFLRMIETVQCPHLN